MNRELYLSYDNDLFFGTDQYYTSGANIIYSRLIKSSSNFYKKFSSKKSDTLKVITRYHYGHQIITPSKIKQRGMQNFDRPYAGWHYLIFEVLNFPSANSMNTYQLELGMVGEKSGVGNFQKWWHSNAGITMPRGWDYEIANEPLIEFSFKRDYLWKPIKLIGLSSSSAVFVGNRENAVTQDITARFGKFNRLINSGYANSRLSSILPEVNNNDPEEEEGYLFYGVNASYVLSNIFIEGSLFNENSPHVENVEHLVFTRHWGFTYTNYYTTFTFIFYRIDPEAVGAKKHRYFSLSLSFRF